MNRSQIQQIISGRSIPDPCPAPQMVETHISWVILGDKFAFKIKKPLKLPFLDFSTLEKRLHFCKEELALNARLTHDMYLEVLPVHKEGERIWIGNPEGEIIDYALLMRRLDTQLEMDRMLKAGEVNREHMQQLARVIGHFHRHTRVIKSGWAPSVLRNEFNAIETFIPFVLTCGKKKLKEQLLRGIGGSNEFLDQQAQRLRQRQEAGLVRDCHGDLHSGNIFLYEPPVIFDCIEFNHEFREIDVLSEVAFLAMDLEYYGREDLAEYFMDAYLEEFDAVKIPADEQLFQYFKLYRANVRAKVHLMAARQAEGDGELEKQLHISCLYGQLMEKYLSALTSVA